MQNSPRDQEVIDLSELELMATGFHDVRNISPLHITVIDVLSDVIGVDPTETSLALSSHVSMSSLDSLCDKRSHDDDSDYGMYFRYKDFGFDLFVLTRKCGGVWIYDISEKCSSE